MTSFIFINGKSGNETVKSENHVKKYFFIQAGKGT